MLSSVPSAVKSHKLPLSEINKDGLGIDVSESRCLEIFGYIPVIPGSQWETSA